MCERLEVHLSAMPASPTNVWVVRIPAEHWQSLPVNAAIQHFAQVVLPHDASVLVLEEGTELYPVTREQVKGWYQQVVLEQGPMVVVVDPETEARCPMCGQGKIRVLADDAPRTGS